MANELSTMHHNAKVFLDRVKLNCLICTMTENDSRRELANKVLNRTLEYEKRHNKPCMTVPVKVCELRKLFPNYVENPQIWWK